MMNGKAVKFKCLEVVSGHYRYMGAVENHNSLRHDDGNKPQIGL